MDTTTGASAAIATQAAAEAAAQTAGAIASVEGAAAAAIEYATERADAAQEAANQLADAAMATAIGQQLEDLNRRFSSWRDESGVKAAGTEAAITEIRGSLTSLSAQLTEMAAKLLTPPTLPAERPPASEAPPSSITELPVEEVENAEATLVNPAADVVQKTRKVVWR